MNKTNIKNFSTEFLILILKIIFGVIIIVGGVSVVLNSEGVVVLVALISGFLIVIPIEIIIIFGTVLIIIGIAFIALSTIISLKNLKKHKKEEIRYEEKQEYMNPSWLKHQYYDLGKSLQDIANEQNVSIVTIRKWIDKLSRVSED